MKRNEMQALLDLEKWCRESSPQLKSMMLEMHLNKIDRARITDALDKKEAENDFFSGMIPWEQVEGIFDELNKISFEDLFQGTDKLFDNWVFFC